jgi:hypothetical protein
MPQLRTFAFAGLFAVIAALGGQAARAQDRAPVVAVFELQDATNRPRRLMAGLTDYLRVKLAETRLVKVVDKGDQETQLKKLIKAERKSSYRACVDESCQIPLGKELAADRILRGKITRFGKSYVLAVEMVELASGASAGAASDKNDGTEEGLMASVEKVAAILTDGLRMQAADAEKVRREKEEADKAAIQASAKLDVQPQPAAQPATSAKLVVDTSPTTAEYVMIFGGWTVFAVAYIGEIIINLVAEDLTSTYYAFFPVVGPVFIEMINKNVPGRESQPLNYVSAGVQLAGAAIAVVGHVLAGSHQKSAALKSEPDSLLGSVDVYVGPGTVGLSGTF